MVHALEKIHRLLAPDGLLIDLHPTADPPPLEVRRGGEITIAGWLQETDDYVEYAQADSALQASQETGLFELEFSRTFDFLTHAGTLGELTNHLSREWKDAVIDEQTLGRIEELLLTPEQDREIRIRETGRISRLRARRP